VICSSFEIISSLILTPDEFSEIKPVYVEQVLEKLRHKADLEAKLLLREYHARGRKVNLVELSKILSDIINRVTDLVSASLDELSEKEFRTDLSNHIILSYVPAVLAEKYSERILGQIPRSYRQAIVSADTAARIVYAEGISFFEHLADEDVVNTIQIYLSKERKLIKLIKAVEEAELDHKEDIMKILSVAGARTLTMLKRNL
jgi:glutamate dehydrogenase